MIECRNRRRKEEDTKKQINSNNKVIEIIFEVKYFWGITKIASVSKILVNT
jgi:hypothetical protein